MVKERKQARGLNVGMIAADDAPFAQHLGMFDAKARKKALADINSLHGDGRQMLGAALTAIQTIQAVVKKRPEGLDVGGAVALARQITDDTTAFKQRLDVIGNKIPKEPSDEAVLATLHIATELQQWSEDWATVAQPMIDKAIKLMENSNG